MSCTFTVLHTHDIGWDDQGVWRSLTGYPYLSEPDEQQINAVIHRTVIRRPEAAAEAAAEEAAEAERLEVEAAYQAALEGCGARGPVDIAGRICERRVNDAFGRGD